MDAHLLTFALAAVLTAAAGAALHLRKRARVRGARGELFRDVAPLFTDAEVTQDDVGFPVLTGRRDAHRWRLEPLVDSLTFRKLPVLWLCVTCYADLDVPEPVSVLLRPVGNEFFSRNREYPHQLPLPAGCPEHARAASTSQDADAGHVLGPLTALLEEESTKEVTVSSRGARVVYRLGEADPGPYRVGRRTDLGAPVLAETHLTARCDAIAAAVRTHEAVRTP
ncbi:hypothetical protein HCC61_08125 [Streptomyces sp. HNM0575]|uniref:hypothetical protein n=1 Tax=Streptomyces sp. HNM0575 TaxID=2716338 RepID=UPI00145EF8B7|nr:hypothetical protein [Streptomyces sp. HNM0575]NLU72638.1 hypothetical protein [Streptomyces sp. HNM0575]